MKENLETESHMEKESRTGEMAVNMTETGRWENLSDKVKRFIQMAKPRSDIGTVLNLLKEVFLITI
jgi:hypothetical protein